mgnify:CR=1 FL=1
MGELVRSGQSQNLMSIESLVLDSTTIAETLLVVVVQESGATPLTQMSDSSPALFHIVMQHTTVRTGIRMVVMVMHWGPATLEG